jgi:predicted RNA-binding Zn-ribbon protein involved in translation (DUF1610 family)
MTSSFRLGCVAGIDLVARISGSGSAGAMTTVPCSSCGARAVPTAGAPVFTRCPRCGAPLVLLRHDDSNVENTVREWLYRRPDTDAAMAARLRAVAQHTRRPRSQPATGKCRRGATAAY